MPQPTYTPLATVTLGASASSVTFSSIPATYRDLILVSSPLHPSDVAILLRPNNSTTDASNVFMFGNGSTTASGTESRIVGATSNTSSSTMILQIFDYAATDKHKTFLLRSDKSSNTIAYAARWAQTTAITSLVLVPETSTLSAGSTFNLYGVIA
jgi:hypothetical protein